MTSTGLTGAVAACSLLLACAAAPEKTGVAIGQEAPDFTLKDQNDRDISLEALLKRGAVAAVFFRSADW